MHPNPSIFSRALGAVLTATFATIAFAPPPVHAAPESVTRDAPGVAADAADVMVCPIPAGSEFTDSWGARRSGGRRHKGVDMVADRGTPIVAAQSGAATFKRSRLGGNAVWLTTEAGNKFYYAHLDAFEGESRDVAAGDVIGYVGSTGNANGPHLHFETHVEGSATNPYDATRAACTEPANDPVIETEADSQGRPALRAPQPAAGRALGLVPIGRLR